jgi:hypothetical protein
VLVFAIVLSSFGWADVLTLNFGCITNNNADDCNIGEAQLRVDVIGNPDSSDFGAGGVASPDADQVLFRFYQVLPLGGWLPMSISEVYFDDGALLGINQLYETSGVNFDQASVNPTDLPGGNTIVPPFAVTEGFWADRVSAAANGVNAVGESLGILFDLVNGQDYDGVLAALDDGSLRIGLHVGSFTSGGSESFVNDPPVPPSEIPEPASYVLVGGGLLVLFSRLRRRVAQ